MDCAIITSSCNPLSTGENMFNIQAWADEFFKQPTVPMSNQMSEIFLRMMFMEQDPAPKKIPEIESQFLYQVIDKRAEHIGLELSKPAKIFLMFQTHSPGTAVMYLYAFRTKYKSVNMGTIANMFPMGFPSEDSLQVMWDKQKDYLNDGRSYNCLDSYHFSDNKKKNTP
jgi:hypothetical protein